MVALKKLIAPVLASTAMAFGAASAHALDLDVGQCASVADVSAQLNQEGQSAFGKGRRLSTPKEQAELHITRPVLFGLIYFSNANRNQGYIIKTNVPLEQGPTQMCVDHVIGDIQPADARVQTTPSSFEKSAILKDYLKALAEKPLNERVMFQANNLKKTSQGYQADGSIITATANMAGETDPRKGNGVILFTEAATGKTSRIYSAAGLQYTQNGLTMLSRMQGNGAQVATVQQKPGVN